MRGHASALVSALALFGLASCATASSPTVALGSVGVILVRDETTGATFVRDVPLSDGLDAGLLPGDELVMVDGQYARAFDSDALRTKLRGPVGTTIALTVVRGSAVVRLEVARVPLLPSAGRAELAPSAPAVVSP
jgi:C-terminal processing protease CtpA/Prc